VVSAGGVTLIRQCAECAGNRLPADEAHWEAYLTDREPPDVVFYCPECEPRPPSCAPRSLTTSSSQAGRTGPPADFCEVELLFDNEHGALAELHFAEVSFVRRTNLVEELEASEVPVA
jgi:hypothetical protein